MTKQPLKKRIKNSMKEFGFWTFLIVAVLILLGTGFLPIILSLIHNNWIYMAMYHVIAVPIVLELIVFVIIFKIKAD